MGDLFFILRMGVYTIIVVLVMQVKIGPQTVEDRVIEFTHKSQLASVIQEVAQGAVSFIGVQYNNIAGKVNTRFFKSHGQEQAPGKRLQSKIQGLKNSLRGRFNEEKAEIKESIEESAEEGHRHLDQVIDDTDEEITEI